MKNIENTDNNFFTVKFFLVCIIIVFLSIMLLADNVLAVCAVDISDTPMETKIKSAPANIMFVIDNSGSMDWEFMTTENDGLYQGKYYIYPDAAYINSNDRVYGTGHDLGGKNIQWKSQWSGYNRIFYNPNAFYSPWPTMSNADTSHPWSNPNNNSAGDSQFNMNGEFYSVGAGGSAEVIVDNQDSGFFMNTTAAWSPYSGNSSYNGDYYYTNSNNDAVDDWVTWTPVLPVSGHYTIAVWWTINGSRDSSVYYTVHHQGLDTVKGPFNMQNNGGQWNDMGDLDFAADGTEYVKLDPDISGASRYSADAVKFYIPAAPVSVKNAHYFIIND